jgi:hypothetical protein
MAKEEGATAPVASSNGLGAYDRLSGRRQRETFESRVGLTAGSRTTYGRSLR